jgi:glycosyltransferase involved in cell wall biosynthesis
VVRRPRACIVRFQPLDLPTRREAEALVAEGFDTIVLCLKEEHEPKRERVDGYEVRRSSISKSRGSAVRYFVTYLQWFLLGFSWLTVQHLRRRFAVVQISTLPDTQVFAALVPRLTGAKVVVFLKEPTGELFELLYGSQRLGRLANLVAGLAIRFAHLAFTVSDQHKETYVQRGADERKIISIPNSMPITAFARTALERRPDDTYFVVLCHGTIEDRWGHDVIIRAAALARAKIPNLQVRFPGRGTAQPSLEQLAVDLGVDDIVVFPGFLSFDELGKELMRAHVGVSAQKASAYSHVVQTGKMYEFLALGIPCIVTRLRSTEAYFTPDALVFVEPGDHDELAAAIVALAHDPERCATLAANGAAALIPYGWDVQQHRYRGAVRELIGLSDSR